MDIIKIKKRIALVAHDNLKRDLADWVAWNSDKLMEHQLVCTGTTGKMVAKTLSEKHERCERVLGSDEMCAPVPEITMLKSGPLGGDQQLGAMISEGKVDAVIFFWDPMQAQPHDVDVKALLRLATLYNVPTAINRSSADFLISSPLFEDGDYRCEARDYRDYIERALQ
ncbi:MAG: methylglyoxal synthase [Alistipes sp.]|jgi:methylglyoxal synthase|nr:methylglyoxal synthase [Alistipes sp.]